MVITLKSTLMQLYVEFELRNENFRSVKWFPVMWKGCHNLKSAGIFFALQTYTMVRQTNAIGR